MKEHALIIDFVCLACSVNYFANKIENDPLRGAVQGGCIGMSLALGTSIGARQAKKRDIEAIHKFFDDLRNTK